jgi:L-malate glycosyltransferase
LAEPLHILYLSSWYPNQQDPTLGIFVRRHAEAASLNNQITMLHASPDDTMLEGEFRLEKSEKGQFKELLLYYGPSRSKVSIVRKLKNLRLRNKYYRFGFKKAIEWSGKFDLIHLHIPWPFGKYCATIQP